MKFFEVVNPPSALVCAEDNIACREVCLQQLAGNRHEPIRITDCHEIRFGQMLRATSDVINVETNQPFGLNEAANRIVHSVFQQEPIVFWKTEAQP